MSERTNYYRKAQSDAWDTVEEFADTITEQVQRGEEVSSDLYNDYPNGDDYHHSTHVDKWYNLTQAAEVLDQLAEHTEEDSGLWQGQEPREAIGTQAAFTYGNAVMAEWQSLVEELNTELSDVTLEFPDTTEVAEEERQTTEAQVRYCRFWLLLSRKEWESDTLRTLYTATEKALKNGSTTELLVFADALQEDGEEAQAKELREIAAFTLPTETE